MAGSNWRVDSFSASMPGGAVQGGGGGSYATDVIQCRDPLDAKRSAAGFAPGASYPDGYLGNITDRQNDKVFNAVKGKLSSKSYARRASRSGWSAGVGSLVRTRGRAIFEGPLVANLSLQLKDLAALAGQVQGLARCDALPALSPAGIGSQLGCGRLGALIG
jgi:hypothetical protein